MSLWVSLTILFLVKVPLKHIFRRPTVTQGKIDVGMRVRSLKSPLPFTFLRQLELRNFFCRQSWVTRIHKSPSNRSFVRFPYYKGFQRKCWDMTPPLLRETLDYLHPSLRLRWKLVDVLKTVWWNNEFGSHKRSHVTLCVFLTRSITHTSRTVWRTVCHKYFTVV